MTVQSFTQSFSKVLVILFFCISLSVFSLLFLLLLLLFRKILIFVCLLSLLWFYTCSQEQVRFTVQSVFLHTDILAMSTVARKPSYNNLLCFNLFMTPLLLLLYPQTFVESRISLSGCI